MSFRIPSGTTFSVTPDSATSNNVDLGNGAFAYVRSANVTTIVQQGGAGSYTTAGVVGTIVVDNDSTANHAGWTLGVIYSNPNLPFRNMSLRAGAVLVQASSSAVNTTITGFATPVTGTLGGRALFSAQEGDANRSGDQALFGPTTSTLVALSGPNNFAANFFASQINNDAGQLDTTGTFGTRNQVNGNPGTNIVGGRQGWDITNVDISARLINNQSSAVLSLTTSGDAYVLNANAIQVDINAPKVTVTKSANVTGTIVGDTVTYTVTVINTGTASASNVVLSDVLPAGTSFVSRSVVVAGVSRPSYDITAGIPLGTVAFGTSVIVTYQAIVNSLPSPQTIPNMANAAFTFQSVAGGSVISGVIPSNTVALPVYSPVLTMVKSASSPSAIVGNTVTYTVQMTNSGNIGAVTTFTDNIPAGSSYVAGSFTVNGTPLAGNPAAGIAIGTIAAGSSATVQFSVLVNSLPSPPQLTDLATAAYTFVVPDGRTVSGSSSSNTLTLPVTLPSVSVTKTASLADIAVGENLLYTSVISNTGAGPVSGVVLSDALPAGTSFVSGSITVNGTARTGVDPGTGIPLGTIPSGSSVTVSFLANVNSLPSPAQLVNRSSVSYSSGVFTATAQSNSVTTPVYQAAVTLVKTASPATAMVGGFVVYTLNVQNTGNIPVTLNVTDTIPAATTYVPGSVTVNGVSVPAASPVTGIGLGIINPGIAAVITFQVTVNSLPSPAVISNQGTGSYTYTLPSGRTLSGSNGSNTATVAVSSPVLNLTKSVNLTSAAVGENLIYTLLLANPGNVAVNNVVVSDSIPVGGTFVPGSVTINGAASPNANPANGITLGTIAAGTSVTLIFTVNVASLPSPAVFNNRASASFTSGSFNGTSTSNQVTTSIYIPVISMIKTGNVSPASVGSSLSYSILISNSGNIASTLLLTDILPPQAVFEPNSVIIGGTPVPAYDPLTGIPVGPLAPGGSVTVSFLVTIVSLPPSQQLQNTANAVSSFTLPDGRTLSTAASSNTLITPVSAPNLSIVKSVNAIDAVTGDTLTFTSVLTNNSITTVSNVIFQDPLPENAAFIPGSVIVGGINQPLAVPTAGIPIGALAPGASVTVTFGVRITMPVPSVINNQSQASFTSGVFSGSSTSNTTSTPVTQPQISLQKTAVDNGVTGNVTVGDTVVYSVVVTNSGNLAANVTLTDTIPASTLFVPNSVIVDGFPLPGTAPDTGIPVGTVAAGASVTVSFSVEVVSLPSPQQITNQATATFTYTPADGRLLTGSAQSNIVTLPVSAPNVAVVKSTSSTAAALGDTITYTVNITNTGIETVNNIVVTDPTPNGTTFVPGSVTVNGTPFLSANPISGISIGSLAAGATDVVSYSYTVTSVPAGSTISNVATVTYTSGVFSGSSLSNSLSVPFFQPVISLAKSGSTANATVGDTISYTLTVTNTGNYGANLTFTDNVPAGTSFVPNSVLVNGLPLPLADPSTGIQAGVLAAGATTIVIFSVVVNSLTTPQLLVNQGTANYTFTLPDGRTLNGSVLSNTVSIPVSAPEVVVTKTTTTTATTNGDTVTYSVTVLNAGIAAVSNAVFNDALPAGTAFVPGSVFVDGVQQPAANPATGVALGTLAPGASVNVTFSVTVNTLPASGTINNQSSVSFTSGAFSSVAFSNTVSTPVLTPALTALKNPSQTVATVGDTLNYTITVTNSGNYAAAATLTDTVPAGASFVPNSVLVQGNVLPGADPGSGIPLGTIAPGSSVTVNFSVVISTLPASQQLTNQAVVTTAYTLPDGRSFNQSLNSNLTQVPVSSPDVTVTAASSVTDAVVGDTVPYTITVTNNGIAAVDNVVLSELLPTGTTFVPGSVVINGVPSPNANPQAGISIGSIAPGASTVVTFNVTVNSLPASGSISNQASVSFTSGAFSGASYSNTLVTPVYLPIINLVKAADRTIVTVGDTVTYSVNVTNTGNLPANVTLTDTIPAGAVFVPNSATVNGLPIPGADPQAGINIGIVNPGATLNVLLTLLVTVVSLPSPQQLVNQAFASFTFSPPDGRVLSGSSQSNILTIPVSSPDVVVTKSTPAVDAVVGDIITYTITVTNAGIGTVNNVLLVDPIPSGSQFVIGSVTVNGTPQPLANPATGIQIGSIAPGASAVVTFQVQVIVI